MIHGGAPTAANGASRMVDALVEAARRPGPRSLFRTKEGSPRRFALNETDFARNETTARRDKPNDPSRGSASAALGEPALRGHR